MLLLFLVTSRKLRNVVCLIEKSCRWSLGVEGRQTESNVIGRRLSAYATPRVLSERMVPLAPPERFISQEALHLVTFADWEGIVALDPPPETADYPVAVHHFARRWVNKAVAGCHRGHEC